MEHLSPLSNTTPLIKPVQPPSGDLASFLREGRVLAGQVVENKDGKHATVAIGKHRLPVESRTELRPGDRFLFRVEGSAGRLGLRVIDGERKPTPALLDALRSVVVADRPRGELIGALLTRLTTGAGTDAVARELATLVRSQVFQPGMTGEALATLLDTSGVRHESALLELALIGADDRPRTELIRELAVMLAERAVATTSSQGATGLLRPFVDAIEAVLARIFLRGGPGPDAALLADDSAFTRFVASLNGEAVSAVRKVTARDARSAGTRADLISGLGALEAHGLESRPLTALVRRLLGETWSDELVGRKAQEARTSVKSVLLRALPELSEEIRQLVERTLTNLESEQLKNLARSETGDPRHWSLPVPDGSGWTTAHLFVQRDPHHGEDDHDDARRFILGVELSRIGPVRADVILRDRSVALKLVVTRQEVAEELKSVLGELNERLAIGGRSVSVAVVVRSAEQASVEELERDIALLSEKHLMDVNG